MCYSKKAILKRLILKILILDRFLLQDRERQIISTHPFPNMDLRAASLWASGVFASFPVCSGLEKEKTQQNVQ